MLGHQPDVLSSGNGSQNCTLLFVVLDGLSGHESCSTIAELDDDGGLEHLGSLHDCVDGGGGGAVEGGQGNGVIFAVGHELEEVVSGDNSGRNNAVESRHGY